jgi:hypothetical protein
MILPYILVIDCNKHLVTSVFTSRPTTLLASTEVSASSQDSVVGTGTGYMLSDQGVRVRELSLHAIQTGSGVHPASYPMGTGDPFPGVKWPRREADHSPPTNAEVKKM